jgi:PAS domain S-box-containing protein
MIIPLDPKQPDAGNGPNGGGDWQSLQPLLRAIVRDVKDHAVFLIDEKGRIRTWSSGAEAMSGWSQAEIIGQPLARLYPAGESERAARTLSEAERAERFEDEGWLIRRDGGRYWATLATTAVREDGGKLVGYLVIGRDLTARLLREKELRESEERFRLLVEGVRDYAIFTLDTTGHVRSWNAGARQIKGYEAHEIIGSHFSRFYPPDAIARGWPDYELRVAAMEGRFEDEGWRLRKDGTRFWANVIITALRDARGELRGFSKITRDLSERRRHEEQLRRSEERFRLLVDGVRDYALYMLDVRGFVSSWNAGAERIEGYRADEIIGRHFSNFYSPQDIAADRPWRELATARERGRLEIEGWRLRKDGTSYWARVIITPLTDLQGQPYGFANLTQDLTQQRHAEALENAAARMNEFIAMLAHELRNPLAPIRNAVMLMQKKGMGDTLLESMRQTIDRQSRSLERIVGDLLDASRVARGELVLERRPLDLADVIERAIESSRPAIDREGHQLHVSVPEGGIPVKGDALRLGQVIVNLLNNAAKYMTARGDIWLTVREKGSEIELRVRDAGVGIRPEMLSRIFDLFTQDHDTLDRAGGGLGVGLALVRRIVELHGGRVEARSEGRGRGSEFIVYLPALRPPVARAAGNATSSASNPATASSATGGEVASPATSVPIAEAALPRRRIVVADDNVDAAQTLEVLLTAMGQETTVAHDGLRAIEAVERFRPDIVLLDIGMPKLDGYAVAERLRAMPGGSRLVLAAITGWGQESDRRRAREVGFDFHFAKPVSEAALRRIITAEPGRT